VNAQNVTMSVPHGYKTKMANGIAQSLRVEMKMVECKHCGSKITHPLQRDTSQVICQKCGKLTPKNYKKPNKITITKKEQTK